MLLRYTPVDPTKNITLLVTTPVARELQAQTALWLLRHEPDAEQVGFLEPSAKATAHSLGSGKKEPAFREEI